MTQKIYTTYVELHDDTYYHDPNIVSVDLMQTPWVNNTMWGAFEDCPNLQSVTNISPQVTNMQAAFYNCQRLTSTPTLPSSVTSLHSTFYGCPNLTTMPTIPGNVIDMAYAFMYCNNMSTTTAIPNSVNDVCYCFAYTNISASPTLPPSITELDYTYAFCKNLNTTPTIPPSVTSLIGAFQGCEKITTPPTIPGNATDLSYTFSGCYNLRTAPEISNNVNYLDETFKDCYNLSGDIIIRTPNIIHNVTAINTFDNTSLRKNVYIPPYYYNDTTTHSETYNAFIEAGYDDKGTKDGVYLCYNYYPALPSDWITSTAANGTTILEQYIGTNTTVVTPHNDWYSNKIMNTGTRNDSQFTNNTNITHVDLGGVEFINNTAISTFRNCTNLVSVTNLSPNITDLALTFMNCSSLESIPTLPPNIQILNFTFSLCSNITSLPTLPTSLIDIQGAFGATGITGGLTINLPNVTNGIYAFRNVRGLTSINANLPKANNLAHFVNNCDNLTDVNIIAPNCTYIVNIFYNCTNLTNVYLKFDNVTDATNLFSNCTNLVNVSWSIPNATILRNTFLNCQNLTTVPTISNSVTDMYGTFRQCYNLTDAPILPNSVTDMTDAFTLCYNLVNAPVIPESVTLLTNAFSDCHNLAVAPNIPSSFNKSLQSTFRGCYNLTTVYSLGNAYNLVNTFNGCYSLVNIPSIPNTVTDMRNTFRRCTNLAGNIYIHSNRVSYANYCFYNTSLTKNVYIPFEYENGVATQTYNSFIAAGYGTEDYLHGVHLKDIDGSKITINPTPADATVLMYSEATGKEIDEDVLNKFTYVKTGDDVEITGLNTTDTAIVVPSIWTETKSMRVIDGSKIHYKVFKDGYNTVESEITVDGSQTIDVNLKQIMCTFTVVPFPSDATVTLATSSGITYYCWSERADSEYVYTTTLTPTTSSQLYQYFSSSGQMLPSSDTYISEVAADYSYIVESLSGSTPVTWDCTRDAENDITISYQQEGNSITVPWGTEVSYTVSKEHYQTVTGTEIVKTTGNKYIPLAIDQHTFTINPTPADAAVQILVNGKLVNASSTDWVFTANNLNGDIELQEYIGSNTVVSIPTSFETTNTVTADYGSAIEWKVSKDGYITQTDTLILEQDTTLNINLQIPGVDTTDYIYTYDGDTLILSKYTGSSTNIETPTIQGVNE